jgi:hypothetical protein
LTEADGIYGREEDLRQLLAMVIRPEFRLGTLWGETGSGKTSLVCAGVMPALQHQRYLPVYVNRYDDPEGKLARAVTAAAKLDAPAGSLSETLHTAARATDKTVILLCDQFERVFTDLPTHGRQ